MTKIRRVSDKFEKSQMLSMTIDGHEITKYGNLRPNFFIQVKSLD